MSRNKSFDVRARLGAIYSASKTKKYLLKNNTIGNQLLCSFLANIELTCPENSNWWLLLPDSNLFLKFQNNFTPELWTTFSYGLLLQRFFMKFRRHIYYHNKSRYQKFQWKISAKSFTRRDFLHMECLRRHVTNNSLLRFAEVLAVNIGLTCWV